MKMETVRRLLDVKIKKTKYIIKKTLPKSNNTNALSYIRYESRRGHREKARCKRQKIKFIVRVCAFVLLLQ